MKAETRRGSRDLRDETRAETRPEKIEENPQTIGRAVGALHALYPHMPRVALLADVRAVLSSLSVEDLLSLAFTEEERDGMLRRLQPSSHHAGERSAVAKLRGSDAR